MEPQCIFILITYIVVPTELGIFQGFFPKLFKVKT